MEEKEKSKIWIEEKNIVNVKIGEDVTRDDIMDLFDKGEIIARDLLGNISILIDLKSGFFIRSSKARKEIAEKFQELVKNPGFKKVAVFGGVTAITIASFIISLSKMKNVKTFSKREKALEWLKKSS